MESRFTILLGALGRFLIGLGLVVLLFAAYQLWGTGLQEGRAQAALEDQFADRQAALEALDLPDRVVEGGRTGSVPTDSGAAGPGQVEPESATPVTLPIELAPDLAEELIPDRGEALGQIRIPSIGVDKTIVEGVGRDDLRKGPGHYSDSPFPGQAGNAAIAGHRTTYGQPFHDLDLVRPGDLIEIETVQGIFYYEVIGHPSPDGNELGYFIVSPSQVDVVEDQGDNRLTLTACHPKYSARQRIIVTARMVGAPAPTLVAAGAESTVEALPGEEVDGVGATTVDSEDPASTVADEESLEESLGWHMEELPATIMWSVVAMLVLLSGWLLARGWRRWPAYALSAPIFAVVLFIAFGHLDRMLPAF